MSPRRLSMPILLLSLGLAAPAAAQPAADKSGELLQAPDPVYMYTYIDDQGQLHAVDNLEAVPYRYRSGVTRMVQEPAKTEEQELDDELERRRAESDRLIKEARLQAQEANNARQRERVDEARKKLAEKEDERGPEKEDGADPKQRLKQLRDELAKLEAQVGALEEGYSPSEDFEGLSGDQIDAKLVNIEVRMKTIEKEIKKIERR